MNLVLWFIFFSLPDLISFHFISIGSIFHPLYILILSQSQVKEWWTLVARKTGKDRPQFTCRSEEGCQRYPFDFSCRRSVIINICKNKRVEWEMPSLLLCLIAWETRRLLTHSMSVLWGAKTRSLHSITDHKWFSINSPLHPFFCLFFILSHLLCLTESVFTLPFIPKKIV